VAFRNRRHPVILAAIAHHRVTGTLEARGRDIVSHGPSSARRCRRTRWITAVAAYREEGRRLAAAVEGIGAVERALRASRSNRPAARNREERDRMNKHDL
jgi:hypothetical protein